MSIFEEMENDFKKFCDTSKKFIADYEKNQKELELLRKMTDVLQEENLDYRYDITDIACEKATEMARDWEEQYKYEIAVLEKALELACENSCFEDTCDYCSYCKEVGCPKYCETEQGFEVKQAINYFKTKAKEELKSE